jgi:hypothetical protein
VTVSTWSILRASARSDGGRVLEHGLPPRALAVYLKSTPGAGHRHRDGDYQGVISSSCWQGVGGR